MIRSLLGAVAVCAAALFLTGCSNSAPPIVPVEGVVLLDGKPLPNAQLQFIPSVNGLGMEYMATGETDKDGRFTLTCNGKPGACACENVVTVIDSPMPGDVRGNQSAEAKYLAGLKNRPIPSDYAAAVRTPLKVTVVAGQTEYKLDLKR